MASALCMSNLTQDHALLDWLVPITEEQLANLLAWN